ncbi:MAG: tetratricopeptide repeat protein [Rikenellaceae bacterium]
MRHIILLLMLCVNFAATAQKLQERGEVRRGNKEFVDENFEAAAEHYVRAMELAPDSYEARYNLGSALIKGGSLEDGEKLLAELTADSLLCDVDRSEAFFNLGNSQFEQQKLQEALESYKNAMRFNSTDAEAKYNYAYTKALLEQQEQNEDQQDQNEENQDQIEDQNQDENDQEDNQDEQEQEQQPNEEEQEDQDQEEEEQPQPSGIPEQEREQMLDAIQAQEDKTQEDLKEKAKGVVIPSAKNW